MIATTTTPNNESNESAKSSKFNPFASSADKGQQPQIIYTPGMPRRYSSDRKEGCIKRRSGGDTYNEGRSIDMVVVTPLPLFTAQLFDQKNPDGSPKIDIWACIGFIDARNTPSVIMLSDGSTEALRPWLEYQQDMESDDIPIGSVITTLSFRPFKSGRGHSYVFSFRIPKSKEEKDKLSLVQSWYMAEEPVVYEPSIPSPILHKLLTRMGFSSAEIGETSPKMQKYIETGEISDVTDSNPTEFDGSGELVVTERNPDVSGIPF